LAPIAYLLQDAFRPAPAPRRWLLTPVCVSVLVHLLILSLMESWDPLALGGPKGPAARIIRIETDTVRPEDIERVAMAPDLAGRDIYAVEATDELIARVFPDRRDSGPRETPKWNVAARYPEEELPLVSLAGLSDRSRAFVRDGELNVVDPGKARIAYIPRLRRVDRTPRQIKVEPKLGDRHADFVRGLPAEEPAFLDSRETPKWKAAARYPEEELPLVSVAGLSDRSETFVRDGELNVVDPGNARIAHIPRLRRVDRTPRQVRVAPKLGDSHADFVRGLPAAEPVFPGSQEQRTLSLEPPPEAAVAEAPGTSALDRGAEGLFAESAPTGPVRPIDLDVKIDVYAEPGGKFRFFRMTVSQKKAGALPVIAKNVLFVVDISASIRLDMLRGVRRAVGNSAAGLNRGDQINVVRFSEQYYKEFDGFVPATGENVARAARGVRKEAGQVRTDVYTVLKDVVADLRSQKTDAPRPTNIFLVSDGNPTTGLQDIRHIVNDLSAITKTDYSIFAINPGARTANAYLLDLLAYRNRGRFVQAKAPADADAAILRLLMQYKDPLLMNLRAQYGNFEVDQVYPGTLPNLYAGRPIVIHGRCRPGDTLAVRIMGDSASGRRKFLYTSTLPEVATDDKSIAREWARGKIHYLASRIAREGEKKTIVDEMRQLSERYKLESPFK